MTIREWVKEIRKIPSIMESMCCIHTWNGTLINVPDIRRHEDYASKIKICNGEVIFRTIYCFIDSNPNTKGLELIEKYKMKEKYKDSFYPENQYYIPENILNRFISINNGIDEYASITVNWWMYEDMQEMRDAMRKDG